MDKRNENLAADKLLPGLPDNKAAELLHLPTTPATAFTHHVLIAGKVAKGAVKNPSKDYLQEAVGKHTKLDIVMSGESKQFTFSTAKSNVTINAIDTSKLKNAKTAEPLFNFLLIKGAEHLNYSDKGTPCIIFPINDFMDFYPIYGSIDAATKGIHNALRTLKNLEARGKFTTHAAKNGKDVNISDVCHSLFIGGARHNNYYCAYLNPEINWESFFGTYFTILPDAYGKIAADNLDGGILYSLVFTTARQKTTAIKDTGKITISIRTIGKNLGLPVENSTAAKAHPKREVIDPIISAIAAIRRHSDPQQLSISYWNEDAAGDPVYLNFKDFMTGYITVSFGGAFKEPFKELADNKQEKTKKAIERSNRIKDAAAAKKIALQEAAGDGGNVQPK